MAQLRVSSLESRRYRGIESNGAQETATQRFHQCTYGLTIMTNETGDSIQSVPVRFMSILRRLISRFYTRTASLKRGTLCRSGPEDVKMPRRKHLAEAANSQHFRTERVVTDIRNSGEDEPNDVPLG